MHYTGTQNESVTHKGQGNFNTVGAAAGIAALLGVNLSENGLLGGRNNNCDHNHDHAPVQYESKECAQLRTALAISEGQKYTEAQSKADMKELYVELRNEDEKLTGAIAEVVKGVTVMGDKIGDLQGEVKGMKVEIERNREEGYRNMRESKEYTDTKVGFESQLRKSDDEKIIIDMDGKFRLLEETKVDWSKRINSQLLCNNGCDC